MIKKIMKKLILIILFMFSFWANAQNGLIWGVDFNEQDKQDHAYYGYVSGFVVNWSTYALLEDTELKPIWAKLISFGVGTVAGATIGHLKEKWDRKQGKIYNVKDLKATFIGGVAGSGTLSLVFYIFLPNRKLPEGTIIYDDIKDIPVVETWSLDNEFINK